MILTDAGPIIAIFDADDVGHAACVFALPAVIPLVTTWPCFAEAMYILRRELGYPGQEALWQLHVAGQLIIHESSLAEQERMRILMDEYRDIPMDLADASLVAATETHNIRRVFTQGEFFLEATERGSGFKVVLVENRHDFKASLNSMIADSEPERRFINALLDTTNLPHYDAWMKSAFTGFYEIEYAWKKGEHPKRGKFNPDFFIKADDRILVIEIKSDDEIREPADENRMKQKYAREHFARVNRQLEDVGNVLQYQFNFLTPSNFGAFFAYLRKGDIQSFQSQLDIKLLDDP